MSDARWDNPRDRDEISRDLDIHWIELGREPASDPRHDDPRDGDEDVRERDRESRGRDPRDVFLDGLELPRGLEREVVFDGDHRYELNGEDSRSLAAVGAFRVIAERDLGDLRDESRGQRQPDLRHLLEQGLTQSVSLGNRERAVTLTKRGHHLLEANRRDGVNSRGQQSYTGVSRPRELSHDVQLYRAYLREEARLRDEGADIRGVVLDHELKREYQEWLQERSRGRADSDGKPDRDVGEIEKWAREHGLPYFDESVHFPDFRIEYEVDGRDHHEDIEVVTENYRGEHAASVARSGFTCYGRSGRSGGRGFDPRVAEDFV